MKNTLRSREFSGTWGQLIFDEIKIKTDLTFDKGTLEHHGVIDFGRDVNFQVENMRVGDRTDFDRLNLHRLSDMN